MKSKAPFSENGTVIDVEAKEVKKAAKSSTSTNKKPAATKTKKSSSEATEPSSSEEIGPPPALPTSTRKKRATSPIKGQAEMDIDQQVPEEDELIPTEDIDSFNAHLPKFFITRKHNKKRFHKANSLVHHHPQQVMTPIQQKLTNILLRHAQNNPPIAELTWIIPSAEVQKTLRSETRNYEHIQKMILQMMNIKVKWDVLETEGVANNYAVVFPRTTYLAGNIKFEIQKDAAALLNNFDSYTSLDLEEEMKLSKSCSIPLYENASRYLNIGQSRWFKWEQFRNLLLTSTNVPKNAETWSSFNERYLSPAVKDVNTRTRLIVTIETERVGVAVKNVRVIVHKQKSQLSSSALNSSMATKGLLSDSMRLLGVKDRTLSKLLAEYSEEQISAAIAHTKWRRDAPNKVPLKMVSKFFTDSLKKGWYNESPTAGSFGTSGDLFPSFDDESANAPRIENKVSAKKSETEIGMEKMVEAVKAQRLMDVKALVGDMSTVEQEVLYVEFNKQFETPALQMKKGRNKVAVVATFYNWLSLKLYGQEITSEEIVKFMARKVGFTGKPI